MVERFLRRVIGVENEKSQTGLSLGIAQSVGKRIANPVPLTFCYVGEIALLS
jgi:hypothetical protein